MDNDHLTDGQNMSAKFPSRTSTSLKLLTFLYHIELTYSYLIVVF